MNLSLRATRIIRLENLGLFRNFSWPKDLPEFARYNLIYGWNGTGKTLPSRVIACLQEGERPQCDKIELCLSDGKRISGEESETARGQIQARVFKRDFVDRNVYGSKGSVGPIYVFGEKERQQGLDKVLSDIQNKESDPETNRKVGQDKKQAPESLCSNGARAVRKTIGITGRGYERGQFRPDAEKLLPKEAQAVLLSDDKREDLLKLIHSEPRNKFQALQLSYESAGPLFEKAQQLCNPSVVSQAIEDLRRRPDVNK